MASLIANCLSKLVIAKKITQRAADSALALHEGMQNRLYPAMPPASADAAAALEAARTMADSAKRRKYQAAMQAIRQAEITSRMEQHSKGKMSGLIAAMTRDVWDDGAAVAADGIDKINVESHTDAIAQGLRAKLNPFIEAYHSRAFGLINDTEAIWNVIREGFGKDTGDQIAKQASKSWKNVIDDATSRVLRGGRDLAVRDDWRFMQFWETNRIRGVSQQEFLNDVMAEVKGGGVRLRDKATDADATAIAIPGIIQNSYNDIFHGRGEGGAGGFSNKMRVFQFDDPESYIRLMQKYGTGKGGLYNAMLGHVEGMAREIAWVETFGPNYESAFNKLWQNASEDYTGRMQGKALAQMGRGLIRDTPIGAQRIFQYLTGQLSAVENDMLAGVFGGLRNLSTSARLGSAIISAVPGDSVTAGIASQYLGIAPTAVLARFLKEIGSDHELAAQMGLSSAAVMDSALGSKRFADEVVGSGLTGRLAETVIRAQGLQAWTEGMKKAFSMEFLGLVARQSDHDFNGLDGNFRSFLQKYGFSPDEWDKLRATPQLNAEGARFFDASGVEDRRLGDRLLSAMIDERRFAVIEPDARVRAMTSGGTKRGTLWGEVARSSFMFKSFSMSLMMTHLMRGARETMQGDWSAAARMGAYFLMSSVAGAAAIQASSLLTGKDPQPMNEPKFWGSAFLRGGGVGFYGDFLYSATTRGQSGVYEAVAGPVLGVGFEMLGKIATGVAKGQDVARWVKAFTPGSTLWYTRAATDRIIFDQMQALIDPDYRKSFAREEQRIRKDYGQGFWWKRGKMLPDRAPDFGNMMRQ